MSDRVCLREGCGQVLVRRPGEKADRWKARRCCSNECTWAHRRAELAVVRPVCARPGCEVRTKKPGRAYCSHRCSAWARRTASGDERRAGRVREAARRAGRPVAPRPERVVAEPADVLPAAPVSSKPKTVWRPAGLSKIPNQWAGHRPPEPDPIDEEAAS